MPSISTADEKEKKICTANHSVKEYILFTNISEFFLTIHVIAVEGR